MKVGYKFEVFPLTYPDDDVPGAVYAVLVNLRPHEAAHHVHQLVVVFITHLVIIIIITIILSVITYWYRHHPTQVITKCIVENKIKLG